MNTQIHDAFINAVLADAAYVEGLTPDLTSTDLASALAGRLTAPLAAYVGQNFRVVTPWQIALVESMLPSGDGHPSGHAQSLPCEYLSTMNLDSLRAGAA